MTDKQNFEKDINVPSKEQVNDLFKNSDKNFNENCTHNKEQIIIDGKITNNFEKIKACKNIREMACVLAFSDLAEILEIEQPIPDEYFYNQWLNKEVADDR